MSWHFHRFPIFANFSGCDLPWNIWKLCVAFVYYVSSASSVEVNHVPRAHVLIAESPRSCAHAEDRNDIGMISECVGRTSKRSPGNGLNCRMLFSWKVAPTEKPTPLQAICLCIALLDASIRNCNCVQVRSAQVANCIKQLPSAILPFCFSGFSSGGVAVEDSEQNPTVVDWESDRFNFSTFSLLFPTFLCHAIYFPSCVHSTYDFIYVTFPGKLAKTVRSSPSRPGHDGVTGKPVTEAFRKARRVKRSCVTLSLCVTHVVSFFFWLRPQGRGLKCIYREWYWIAVGWVWSSPMACYAYHGLGGPGVRFHGFFFQIFVAWRMIFHPTKH